MMKKSFYFMLKAPFVLEIFSFLSLSFDYVGKLLDKKALHNFKIYDVTDWTKNSYNALISQYLSSVKWTVLGQILQT